MIQIRNKLALNDLGNEMGIDYLSRDVQYPLNFRQLDLCAAGWQGGDSEIRDQGYDRRGGGGATVRLRMQKGE